MRALQLRDRPAVSNNRLRQPIGGHPSVGQIEAQDGAKLALMQTGTSKQAKRLACCRQRRLGSVRLIPSHSQFTEEIGLLEDVTAIPEGLQGRFKLADALCEFGSHD